LNRPEIAKKQGFEFGIRDIARGDMEELLRGFFEQQGNDKVGEFWIK
jgi:hypothetical protein